MPRFMAKRITVNGVQQWVSVPIVDEDMAPLKRLPVTSVFDDLETGPSKKLSSYSYYGVWEDED